MVFHTGVLLWCYRLRIVLRHLLFRLFWVQVRLSYLSLHSTLVHKLRQMSRARIPLAAKFIEVVVDIAKHHKAGVYGTAIISMLLQASLGVWLVFTIVATYTRWGNQQCQSSESLLLNHYRRIRSISGKILLPPSLTLEHSPHPSPGRFKYWNRQRTNSALLYGNRHGSHRF